MSTCSHTWKEWDGEKGDWIKKGCQKEIWEGSDEFCIFHDPSPEKDVDLFKEKLEEQMESETERHNFIGYYFPENWDFSRKEFKINARFWGATFQGTAYFSEATFQDADFWGAIFQDAYFSEATFQDAYFEGATFQGTAYFSEATFQSTGDFGGATFQNAYFWEATFQNANFREATFQNANFRYTTTKEFFEFNPKEVSGITDIRGAKFFFSGVVTMDLERAKFHRAHLQNVAFVDCTWPKCKGLFGSYTCIYEEKNMKDEDINLSFNELETNYRDLKQNMQNHGDYRTAGELYYREMEMRRKGAKTKRSRIWLEIYRILAGYGEKPQLVIRNSFVVIVLAAVLFFFSGVARVGAEIPPEENPYIIDYSLDSLNLSITTFKDFGYCLYYSVVTFTTLGYGDIHPLGYSHFLSSAEALTGAFFMALFVVVFARKMMR